MYNHWTYFLGIMNGYFFCIMGVLPNFACAFVSLHGFQQATSSHQILHHMLKRNEKRLDRLSDSLRRYPNDKYSLSLRIQLKENIWSLQVRPSHSYWRLHWGSRNIPFVIMTYFGCLQKIELGVVIIILVLVLNLSLFIAPVSIFTHPDQRTALQWSLWAGNIVLAMLVSFTIVM